MRPPTAVTGSWPGRARQFAGSTARSRLSSRSGKGSPQIFLGWGGGLGGSGNWAGETATRASVLERHSCKSTKPLALVSVRVRAELPRTDPLWPCAFWDYLASPVSRPGDRPPPSRGLGSPGSLGTETLFARDSGLP